MDNLRDEVVDLHVCESFLWRVVYRKRVFVVQAFRTADVGVFNLNHKP